MQRQSGEMRPGETRELPTEAFNELKAIHRAAWEESKKLGLLQCAGCFRKATDNEDDPGAWQAQFPVDPSPDEREETRWLCPACNTHLEILHRALRGEYR